MRQILTLAWLIGISACIGAAPPSAPAPLAFHASKSPKDATQVAVLALMSAGFRVTQTDSLGQAISASRTATHNGNEEYVSCVSPRGSAAAANRETTLTINVKAKPNTSSTGSDIAIDSRVRTSYPGYDGTSMAIAPNDSDCVSNGTMERNLESALR